MRFSFTSLLAHTPSKEKLFFGCVLLVAFYFVLATPLSSEEYSALRTQAIESSAGSYDVNAIKQYLASAVKAPQAQDASAGDLLRQRLTDRMRTLDPELIDTKRRNFYLHGAQVDFPMPPLNLEFPEIPALPGFDIPVGDVPATKLQSRATTKDKREVKLVRDDGTNPFDFDDE